MKNIRFFCPYLGIALVILISGCMSVPPPEPVPASTDEIKGLSGMSGILFDAQTGSPAGEYEFRLKGNAFVLSVKTARTAGPDVKGQALSYAPYEGIFGGIVGSQKNGYLINGADDYEHFFVFIHDQQKETLPGRISAAGQKGRVFLLTVVDKPIYEEIRDNKQGPREAIKTLAPFIRAQALISQ